MNTEHVNKWVTILANIGVLAGIAFLVLEIRLSNRIAVAEAELSIRDHYFAHNELVLTNDQVAELLVRAQNPDAEFSDIEAAKLDAYIYMQMSTWRATEIAYLNGLLPRESFELIDREAAGLLRWYPGLRPIAQKVVDDPSTQDSGYYGARALRQALHEQD